MSSAKRTSFDSLWPLGFSEWKAYKLRQLDDLDFSRLKRHAAKRASRHTGSRTFGKALQRKLELKRRTKARERFSKKVLTAHLRDCEILDALCPNRKDLWRRLPQRIRGKKVSLRNFSFLDDPLGTVALLQEIALAECECVNFSIDFLDQQILDIGPYLVLGVMREKMAPLVGGGVVYHSTQKVLEKVGLREFLRMKSFGRLKMDDVWPLPMHQRRRSGSSQSTKIAYQPTTFEVTADRVAAAVDGWLAALRPPSKLSQWGRGRVKAIVGEVLNNAERHGRSGGDGEWLVAGVMVRRALVADVRGYAHVCNLTFYNPGRPIAVTLADGPLSIRRQLERYHLIHRRSGTAASVLTTVLAIQDGISRVEQAGNPTGGTGLQDIVEFAGGVGSDEMGDGFEPRVVIISGRACIRLQSPYMEGVEMTDGGSSGLIRRTT